MKQKATATIIKAEHVSDMISAIPPSWRQAVGVLRHRNINSVRYQKTIRREWEKHLRKQQRLAN